MHKVSKYTFLNTILIDSNRNKKIKAQRCSQSRYFSEIASPASYHIKCTSTKVINKNYPAHKFIHRRIWDSYL